MEENKKGLSFVTIPGEIAFNPDLTFTEKFIWWIVRVLDTSKNHCFASNEYIGNTLGVVPQTVSKAISKLSDMGYIKILEFDGRRRKIKIDEGYVKKYRYLIDEFNLGDLIVGLRQTKSEDIYNKYKISNYKVSSSKEEENKQVCLPTKRKREKIILPEIKEVISDERIRRAIKYWNSKGKPFTRHRVENNKTIKRINSLLRKRMGRKGITLKEIVNAIDNYYELVTSPLTTINKVFNMSQFILFDAYQIPKGKINISSWFDECLKGREYLFEKYARYVKDKHPELTEKIKKIWKDKDLYVSKTDYAYMENNFRVAADRTIKFIEKNSNKLKLNRLERRPMQFIYYVFDAALSRGDINKMRPGSISNDYMFNEILPDYLKQNGFMK